MSTSMLASYIEKSVVTLGRTIVCQFAVMHSTTSEGVEDEVLESPPKGKGASLTIRYHLPRR